MTSQPDGQPALLITVPEADAVVGRYRDRYDAAARDGIPAHITVAYPFKAVDELTPADLTALQALFAAVEPFEIRLPRTGRFGDRVLFLEPENPEPIVRLTRSVEAAFPDFPIYGGAFEDVRPHLTVGYDVDPEALRAAAAAITPSLPIQTTAARIELWTGPDPDTTPGPWRRVASFPLGA